MTTEDKTKDWWVLRGSLVHRAVLHPGGHWFPISTEEERQNYIDQVRSLAKTLTTALNLAEKLETKEALEQIELVGSLIDTGGPAWGNDWTRDYINLVPADRPKVCWNAEHLAGRIAEELMHMAELGNWHYFLTEVSNPLNLVHALRDSPVLPGALTTDPFESKTKKDWTLRGVRGDFLAVAGDGTPALVEVKTGKIALSSEALEEKYQFEKKKYDELTRAIFDSPTMFLMVRAYADDADEIAWCWTTPEGKPRTIFNPEYPLPA